MYSKLKLVIGVTVLAWAGYATAAILPSTSDLWDISQGSVVTATSGADFPYSDIRDMFGGTFSQREPGDTFFQDGEPAGFVHYVEWQTPAPVTIASFNLFASGDGGTFNNEREFAQFVLKAKSSPSASNFDLTLYTLVVTNHPYTYVDQADLCLVSTNITPVTAQNFRAEFTQYTAGRGFDGPRIIELDGFGPTTPPMVTAGPTNETVTAGQNAGFSVSATGTSPLTYQWYENSTNIPAADNPTATNATLILDDVQTNQSGNSYYVVVSNAFGTTNSGIAMLTVVPYLGPQLMITNEPQSQTVTVGANVTFSVGAVGPGPLNYEWQFNGINLNPTGSIITTVAGGGGGGDGSPATNASLQTPRGVAVDGAGNIFIADQEHNTIRKVAVNGIITTVAGNGNGGLGGDGGPATGASLQFPFGVAVDAAGNLFIADFYDQRIRKVDTNGIITTVAGSGSSSPGGGAYSGDGGPATSARLNEPECVAVDAAGNLFIADYLNNRIRKVDTNGIITTVAGNGTAAFSGDGGQATNASISGPNGVAVDSFGNVFIADSGNSRVREVNAGGIITTIAGGGASSPGDGGPATNAVLMVPTGVVADALGDVFIADPNANRIREVNSNGLITTVAGNGSKGFSGDGGLAINANLNYPYELTLDNSGNIFIVDEGNERIRKVTVSDGPILTINNVTSNNAGNYTVIVSNPFQSVTSTVAVLTVNPLVCTPPPAGLAGWWQGEGNAADSTGLNNGTLVGGLTFAAGEVGQAFNFNGTSGYVSVPASAGLTQVGQGSGLTIEAWINPADQNLRPLVEWNNGGGVWGVHFWINQPTPFGSGPGCLYANLVDSTGQGHSVYSPAGLVTTSGFQHVAVTYDRASGVATFYYNGSMVSQQSIGSYALQTSYPLYLGYRISGAPAGALFSGEMDEVSIYGRALSSNEIQAVYQSGSAGKCDTFPPVITGQPQSEMLFAGRTASFSVTAAGTQPLSYQWLENTTNIPAALNPTATNATLVLNSVSTGQSGNIYSVLVSNSQGSTNSANAALTVLSPGSCYPPPAGIVSWWPGEFSGMDIAGSNNATPVGGVTYVSGEVGEAFSFNGTSQYMDVPNSAGLNPTSGITCEAWIYPRQVPTVPAGAIIKKAGEGTAQQHGYALQFQNNGTTGFWVYVNGNWYGASSGIIPLNQWSHIAGVYDGTHLSIYVNGVPGGTSTLAGGPIVPSGNDLQLGHDPSNPSWYYNGIIDEPSVYSRALSPVEIQDIYDAGSAGKCSEPEIAMQPQNQLGYAGGSATLSVSVAGMGPFTYQWNYNGAPITNQTNATLVLGDLGFGNAGSYTVTVTNPYGSVTSVAAVLQVSPPGLSLALYPGLTISGAPGVTYGIQYSTNLANTNDWVGLANLTLTQTNELYFDLTPATQQHRYYRVLPGPIPIP